MIFDAVNQSLEKVAGFGIMPNMIFHLMNGYHMEAATGSTILFTWSAFSKSLAIFGALLSDFYLGRFRVIAFGSFSSLLVSILLGFLQISFRYESVCFMKSKHQDV